MSLVLNGISCFSSVLSYLGMLKGLFLAIRYRGAV